ncbi:MAG: T3SS effector HopA1 family protein [Aulosira sp. ZfuVER01]|nr:T3SS effector HopA1 family protein [Aulosira sp. ZfuVER01]MDZ8001730.1 T3SS effector HopA1 family protein [Aulosira sp. DedVER01a]MDZ8056492.1 T3SS effector HopA1 family protein [Aulosira sp. ZfuCHP01]
MQLLNSVQSQLQAGINQRLLDVLEDIVNKVEINFDFSIRHPDYKPLEIPAEAVERFQKLPGEMQQKYLSLQLRSFLYGIYYNGSMRTELAADKKENNLPLDLENNTVLGVDIGFYKQLHDSNYGEGYFQPGWSILREESDGSLAVSRGGLRLHIQKDRHLLASDKFAVVGDVIAIKMPKNVVQSGFYMAVGNAGLYRNDLENQQIVRIYFNLTPSGAVAVMGNITQHLNEKNIPFQFKVLYHPKDYKRHDSGVLYFDKQDYEVVKQSLNSIYIENQGDFKSEIPLFTKELAPGLSLAEEPDQKFAERESFGMNRCQIIANGLLEAWYQGDNSPQGRMKAIQEQFSLVGIDFERVHLNANSEDIYKALDLS